MNNASAPSSDPSKGTTAEEARADFTFPVLLSLDIDSIDPQWAPATGTPVPNGMTPAQVGGGFPSGGLSQRIHY